MKKSDLIVGRHHVMFEGQDKLYVYLADLFINEDGYYFVGNYDDNLKHKFRNGRDIVAVYKYLNDGKTELVWQRRKYIENQENIGKPTMVDVILLSALDQQWKYIQRNENGRIIIFQNKPERTKRENINIMTSIRNNWQNLDSYNHHFAFLLPNNKIFLIDDVIRSYVNKNE